MTTWQCHGLCLNNQYVKIKITWSLVSSTWFQSSSSFLLHKCNTAEQRSLSRNSICRTKASKNMLKVRILNEFAIKWRLNSRKFHLCHSLIYRMFLHWEMIHGTSVRYLSSQNLPAFGILCEHHDGPQGICHKATIDMGVRLSIYGALHLTGADQ